MKRAKRIILNLTAIVLIVWGVRHFVRPPHTITDQQHLVMLQTSCCVAGFAWLNDEEVVYSRSDDPVPIRYNTRTRTKVPVPVPKSLAQFMATNDWDAIQPWLPSPDGKRLLWNLNGATNVVVQDVNSGAMLLSLPKLRDPFDHLRVDWPSDSNSLIEIRPAMAGGPATLMTHRLPPGDEAHISTVLLPNITVSDCVEAVGRDRGGHPLALAWKNQGDTVQFALYDLSAAPKSRTPTRLISFPKSQEIVAWALSPRGDRIVWTRRGLHHAQWPRWLPHWIRDRQPGDEYDTFFYVTNLDGSGLREIGHDAAQTPGDFINPPQWVPGGKAISYTRNGSLYTLPVP